MNWLFRKRAPIADRLARLNADIDAALAERKAARPARRKAAGGHPMGEGWA